MAAQAMTSGSEDLGVSDAAVVAQFERAMRSIYSSAKAEVGYTATRFIQMVSERGGVGAARHLILAPTPSEGFTVLVMAERLDLTVEHHVVRPEFVGLFTDEERRIAQRRLDEVSDPQPRRGSAGRLH